MSTYMPWAPRRLYDPYRGGNTIADLLVRGGDIEAQGALRSGEAWGTAAQQLGQIGSEAIQAVAKEGQRKKRDAAVSDFLSAWDGTPETLLRQMTKILGHVDGPKAAEGILAFRRTAAAGANADFEDFRRSIGGSVALGENFFANNWPTIRGGLLPGIGKWLKIAPEKVPERYEPGIWKMVRDLDQRWNPRAGGRLVPVGPGETLFDPTQNEPVYVAPPAPAKVPAPPAVGSFEEYVLRYAAESGKKPEQLTTGDIEAARKKYQQADDRPQQPPVQRFTPKLITVGGKEVQANYDAVTGKYHDPDTGAVLAGVTAAPTADMRNKQVARALVERSIKAIEALSKKVITKRGISQRALAAGRSVEAALGSDPEYRTYQDARMALAGNLAVGQQGSRPSDADIKAIWLPLVPDVFRDTDESAAMKWELIKTMSNTPGAPEAAGGKAKVGRFTVEVE